MVQVELLVLDCQERVQHRFRHLGERDRLAVLTLEHGDDVAHDVVHIAALRQRLELGQADRQLVVCIGDAPQPRPDADHDCSGQQGSGDDDGHETKKPGNETHATRRLVACRCR